MSNIGYLPSEVGVIRSRNADAPCEETSRPWVLAATIIGSAIAFIDSTVTNVALPQIQHRLGATAADSQWIVESYVLFLSALILVGGSLGDHFSRWRSRVRLRQRSLWRARKAPPRRRERANPRAKRFPSEANIYEEVHAYVPAAAVQPHEPDK